MVEPNLREQILAHWQYGTTFQHEQLVLRMLNKIEALERAQRDTAEFLETHDLRPAPTEPATPEPCSHPYEALRLRSAKGSEARVTCQKCLGDLPLNWSL